MNEERTEETNTDTAEEMLWAVIVALLVAAVLPLVVAWRITRTAATHPRIWMAGAASTIAATVLGALAVAGVVAAIWVGWLSPWPPGWNTVAVVALWWVALLPLAYALMRARLPYIATDLHRGLLDPKDAEPVRRAIELAHQRIAQNDLRRELIKEAKDPNRKAPILGVAERHDRRTIWARATDRTAHREGKRAKWVRGPWFVLPNEPVRAVILGESGSGKTTLLRAIVRAALAHGMRVVVLDAKGNQGDAAQMLRDGEDLGARTVHYPSTPFDGWRGDTNQVATKALALMPAGSPQYYDQQAQGALYAVGALTPWRTTAEMLARLHAPANYCTPGNLTTLTVKQQGTPVHLTVEATLRAATRGMDAYVQPNGWGWDDENTDLVVASIAVGGNQAQRAAASLMLADLSAYKTNRRGPNARPLLVIIDEAASLLDAPNAPKLAEEAETVRSAGIGLILAAQSFVGLGEEGKRIAEAGTVKLLGRLTNPDEIATMVGTRKVQEVAHQGTAGGRIRSGETSAREQDALRVDPNRLRRAPAGNFCVVEAEAGARWVQVRTAPHYPGARLPQVSACLVGNSAEHELRTSQQPGPEQTGTPDWDEFPQV